MTAVRLRDLSVGYGRRRVLHHVNLDLAPGRVHGLIGPNGCGKSTLVKTIVGLLDYRGTVTIAGRELTTIPIRHRAHEFAYLAQDPPSTPELTAREIVEMGRYAHRSRLAPPRSSDHHAVDEALALTRAVDWADRRLGSISGGQRQLTHLARAFAQQAPLLVLDEPLAALDLAHQMRVMGLLHPWIAADPRHRTIVIVVHDLTTAARFCDELVLMAPGPDGAHLVARGSVESVLHPEFIEEAFAVSADVRRSPVTGTLTITPVC